MGKARLERGERFLICLFRSFPRKDNVHKFICGVKLVAEVGSAVQHREDTGDFPKVGDAFVQAVADLFGIDRADKRQRRFIRPDSLKNLPPPRADGRRKYPDPVVEVTGEAADDRFVARVREAQPTGGQSSPVFVRTDDDGLAELPRLNGGDDPGGCAAVDDEVVVGGVKGFATEEEERGERSGDFVKCMTSSIAPGIPRRTDRDAESGPSSADSATGKP